MRLLITLLCSCAILTAAERPNIVLIFTDDHALESISAYGKRFDEAYDAENAAFLAAMPNMPDEELTRWKYQRYTKNYLRCIRGVDENIGRLLAYLDESGLAKNTIVIYSSDQGFYLGEHGWYDKRWMFEESLAMPFIIRWPGVVKPGDRTEHLIWRLQNGDIQRVNSEVAVILIGTNNTGQSQRPAAETVGGIKRVLDDLAWKWPDTKIILISVFPRAEKADNPLRKLNDEINTQVKKLADGKRVHLLDINAKFMDAEGTLNQELLPDLLHLSPAAYEIWAEALVPKIGELGLK